MLTVAARAAVVESRLESGALLCPGLGGGWCGGVMPGSGRSGAGGAAGAAAAVAVFGVPGDARVVAGVLPAPAGVLGRGDRRGVGGEGGSGGSGHRPIAVGGGAGVHGAGLVAPVRRPGGGGAGVLHRVGDRDGGGCGAAGSGRVGDRGRGGRGRGVAVRCAATVRRVRSARRGDGVGGGLGGQSWPVVVPGVAAGDPRVARNTS